MMEREEYGVAIKISERADVLSASYHGPGMCYDIMFIWFNRSASYHGPVLCTLVLVFSSTYDVHDIMSIWFIRYMNAVHISNVMKNLIVILSTLRPYVPSSGLPVFPSSSLVGMHLGDRGRRKPGSRRLNATSPTVRSSGSGKNPGRNSLKYWFR